MNKLLPQTSIDAYKAANPEMLSEHYKKILMGLIKLKTATYEEIASMITLDKSQVGRRLNELERMEIVFKPGLKKPTRSGRAAFVYQIRPYVNFDGVKKEVIPEDASGVTIFVQKEMFE
jgi:predicted transcriptional regulator